jgi:hypothetical protein
MYVYMNECMEYKYVCMYSCEQHKVCPQWIKLYHHQERVQNAKIQAHISVTLYICVRMCSLLFFIPHFYGTIVLFLKKLMIWTS